MISNCGHDENGTYSGGVAGDQTGEEWAVIPWYNRPWNCIIRFDGKTRYWIARNARAAAENNLIGYNQNDRNSFYDHLKLSDWKAENITVPCNADCSAGVAAIIQAAGNILNNGLADFPEDAYTGNLKKLCQLYGAEIIITSDFLTDDKQLLQGDILLYENHHTAVNLDTGAEATGWIYTDCGTWEYVENGIPIRNQWKLIDHFWFYFNDDNAVTGFQTIDNSIYYFDDDCYLWHESEKHNGSLTRWYVKYD